MQGVKELARDARRQEAEQRYITGTMTLRSLAKETGISISTLGKWSKAGGWPQKREQVNARAMEKAVQKAVSKRARELERLLAASDDLEAALANAAQAFRDNLENDPKGKLVTDGKFRAGNLSQIVNALGRQTETRMMLAGLMTKADEEKIKLLRRRQRLEEKKEKESRSQGATLGLEKDAEELAQ